MKNKLIGAGYGLSYQLARAFSALRFILDHVKVTHIHEPNEATVRIFATLTNNVPLKSLFYKNESSILEKYKDELRLFMFTKILGVINSAIKMIPEGSMKYIRELVTDEVREKNQALQPFDFKVSGTNRHEFHLMDLNSMNMTIESMLRLSTEEGTQEIMGVLYILIERFQDVYYTVTRGSRTDTAAGDYDKQLFMKISLQLGYLISMLVSEVFASEDAPDEDDNSGHDYMKYSSSGSFTIPNMLCCFENEESLSLAIDNESARLDDISKDMLRNMLVLSNLTKE